MMGQIAPLAITEVVADTGDLCGECPVWNAAVNELWWTDCVGKKLHRWSATDGCVSLIRGNFEAFGFRPNRSGGWIIANSKGVWLWRGEEPRLIVAEVDGALAQINDCTADPTGRLLAGSAFYTPDQPYERGKLFRIDPAGNHAVLDEGFELANGLAFSPDGSTLYFADSIARKIYEYAYARETGTASRRRTLISVPLEEGIPDGLTVDSDGYLWSAQWYGGVVVRYDPDGKVERRIRIPAKQASSVCFGGRELNDLFVTSAAVSEPTPAMPPGYDPETGPFGGQLFRCRTEIRGLPVRECAFELE